MSEEGNTGWIRQSAFSGNNRICHITGSTGCISKGVGRFLQYERGDGAY